MGAVALLLLIVCLVWFWQASLASRELAITAARETCRNNDIQFLDGTASLQMMRPYYSRSGGPGIRRIYTFDYSEDGITRRTGCIVMNNRQITTVLLEG
jgi:hypothetical protein